jgi:hypothetical protein
MGFNHTAAILKKPIVLTYCPSLPRFEEFSIEAKGGRTIDFILLGLKMAACD